MCVCACVPARGWFHRHMCSCSCMYINRVCYSTPCPLTPPLPCLSVVWASDWGPGLSRHGNCTKANKGVEQSRGNTVTQRGYLAQWKVSGEAHTKAKPLLNTRGHAALFCLAPKTPRLHTQMSKSAGCCSSPSFGTTLTYANDSTADLIKLHPFSVIFHT